MSACQVSHIIIFRTRPYCLVLMLVLVLAVHRKGYANNTQQHGQQCSYKATTGRWMVVGLSITYIADLLCKTLHHSPKRERKKIGGKDVPGRAAGGGG